MGEAAGNLYKQQGTYGTVLYCTVCAALYCMYCTVQCCNVRALYCTVLYLHSYHSLCFVVIVRLSFFSFYKYLFLSFLEHSVIFTLIIFFPILPTISSLLFLFCFFYILFLLSSQTSLIHRCLSPLHISFLLLHKLDHSYSPSLTLPFSLSLPTLISFPTYSPLLFPYSSLPPP